jgi:hypothetical protein
MAYLIHIGFDNTHRLSNDVYYFEYKGIRFKLIQNNIRKWCDVLLTIIPDFNDKKAKDEVYIKASEFLSALSWENNSLVKLQNLGGMGIPHNFHLRKAKCRMYSFPQVPFQGHIIGSDIIRIPEIETEEQRDALILFREASSSNNYYLSFLFFWQILEIGGNEPIGWIDKTYHKNRNRIRLTNDELERIPLSGKSFGRYFYDDCRNAIAHIFTRRSGRKKLKIDTPDENTRIAISTRAIKEFARFYIIDKLKLQKHMYLVRRGGGFPTYANDEYRKKYPCKLAYKIQPLKFIRRKQLHKIKST